MPPVSHTTGSVQFSNLPVTVQQPSNRAGYYPNGYSFIRQGLLVGQTDPLVSGGLISVSATNDCIDPRDPDDLGGSRFNQPVNLISTIFGHPELT
jgi:hypothetical protein